MQISVVEFPQYPLKKKERGTKKKDPVLGERHDSGCKRPHGNLGDSVWLVWLAFCPGAAVAAARASEVVGTVPFGNCG